MGVYLNWKDGFVNRIEDLSDIWFEELKRIIKEYLHFYYLTIEDATRSEIIEKLYEFITTAKRINPTLKKLKNDDVLRLSMNTFDGLLGAKIAADSRAAKYYRRMIAISKEIQSYPEHISLDEHLDYYRLFITLSNEVLNSNNIIKDFDFSIDSVHFSDYMEQLLKGTLFPRVKTISKKEKIKSEYDVTNQYSNIMISLLFVKIAYALIMNDMPKEEEALNE